MDSSTAIIIPVYNGTRYLPEAIESVLYQSRPDWTLLVVDDASHDGPSDVVNRFRDSRIRYIRNDQNLGLYPTLMRSLSFTDAEWIAIIMQDDRLKPQYLDEMFALARRYPAAQAIWATENIIDDRGRLLRQGKTTRREEWLPPGVALWLSALHRGCFWTISGSFTRRALLTSIPFRGDLPHCADYDWLLRTVRRVPFLYFEDSLVDLRQHAGQASAQNLRSARDILESYQILRSNLSAFPGDVPQIEAVRICVRRFRLVIRRAAGYFANLRIIPGLNLLAYSFRYLILLAIHRRARLSRHPL